MNYLASAASESAKKEPASGRHGLAALTGADLVTGNDSFVNESNDHQSHC